MKQNISKEALRAVKKLIARASVHEFGILTEEQLGEKYRRLIASLYALRPDADQDVELSLRNFEMPLADYLSEEEIRTLSKEYSAVVRYCFEHIDYDAEETSKTLLPFLKYDYLGKFNIEVIKGLAVPKPQKKAFIPYSGLLFFPNLFKDCVVDSNELTERFWGFSKIMREVYNIAGATDLGMADIEELKGLGKYDYIYAAVRSTINRGLIKRLTEEVSYMATSMLNEGGRLICMTSVNVLNDNRWKELRDAFHSNGLSVNTVRLDNRRLGKYSLDLLFQVTNDHLGHSTYIDHGDKLPVDPKNWFSSVYSPDSNTYK